MARGLALVACAGAVAAALALAGCGREGAEASSIPLGQPPMAALAGTAYEAAAATKLPATKPQEFPGLHNVFRLSDRIVSGSEPHGEDALRQIAAMGVKTILSVDGKVPDAAAASALGMRYVHVPIQYSGITEDEMKRLAKAFLDLPGPVYVHCFHGKHRGPAAAAVGRIVLDGASRETAIAEMRQWGGTSPKYEGLFETIAKCEMPSPRDLAAYEWNYPAAYEFHGFRHTMVGISRSYDVLEALEKREFAADPEHPDVVALNEAATLAKILADSASTDEVKSKPADFRRWLDESVKASRDLSVALQSAALKRSPDGEKAGGEKDALKAAKDAFGIVRQRCDACHKAYRN